jgi:hypothetical protein
MRRRGLDLAGAVDRDNLGRDELCHGIASVSESEQLQCSFVSCHQASDIVRMERLVTQKPLNWHATPQSSGPIVARRL